MPTRIVAASLVLLMGGSALHAQSGIRGVDLPADPLIPIPDRHPNWTVRAFEKSAGLKPLGIALSFQTGLIPWPSIALQCADAAFPSERNGALNRIVYYERQLEGFLRSRFVEKGMCYERVRKILGRGDGSVGGIGGFTHIYFDYGVAVHIPLANGKDRCEGVRSVTWRFQPYPSGRRALENK